MEESDARCPQLRLRRLPLSATSAPFIDTSRDPPAPLGETAQARLGSDGHDDRRAMLRLSPTLISRRLLLRRHDNMEPQRGNYVAGRTPMFLEFGVAGILARENLEQ